MLASMKGQTQDQATTLRAILNCLSVTCRQHLPTGYEMPQPSTHASIQHALQGYAKACSNIKAGVLTCRGLKVTSAAFNANGSYLAVIQDNYVKIHYTRTFTCVTDFTGLGAWAESVSWAEQGTMSVITARLALHDQEGFMALYSGDLLNSSHSECPWAAFEELLLPEPGPDLIMLSPDTSKVFLAAGLEHHEECLEALLSILDACTGDLLWEREVFLVSVEEAVVIWHPNNDACCWIGLVADQNEAGEVVLPDSGLQEEVGSATLSADPPTEQEISDLLRQDPLFGHSPLIPDYLHFSPSGNYLMILYNLASSSKCVIVQWPSAQIVHTLSGISSYPGPLWDSAGGYQFAYFDFSRGKQLHISNIMQEKSSQPSWSVATKASKCWTNLLAVPALVT